MMMTRSSVLWNICFLVLVTQPGSHSQSCDRDWFGTSCTFFCNCPNPPCGVMGQCLRRSPCTPGWFHTACQYSDLLYKFKDSSTENTIADNMDSTCLSDPALTQLRLNFTTPVHVSWFRFIVSIQAEDNLAQLQLAFNERRVPCTNGRRYIVDTRTIDIECDVLEPVSTILLMGKGVGYLCSVYVSGGQNLALMQQTSLSSVGTAVSRQMPPSQSSLAVDGNVGESAGCAKSRATSSTNQTFTLTFRSPVRLTHIIVYGNRYNPSRFHLATTDPSNSVIERHLNLDTDKAAPYLILLNETQTEVRGIHITADNSMAVLEICELQAFGTMLCNPGVHGYACNAACSCLNNTCAAHSGACVAWCVPGYFGPACSESCPDRCHPPGVCDRASGSCPGCAAGYTGLQCQQECPPGTYGNRCSHNCSNGCKDRVCNSTTGNCQSCSHGFYGPSCENPCPVNCDHQSCDPAGLCFQCQPGFFGNVCSSACAGLCHNKGCNMSDGDCISCEDGYYGSKCSSLCPVHCSDNVCDRVTGNCNSCESGYFQEDCSTPCPENCADAQCDMYNGSCGADCRDGYFGSMCSIACPHSCKELKCHKLTGLCLACDNHYGTYCTVECPQACANKTCGRKTGYCLFCQKGHFGFHCGQTCPFNCAGDICHINNGSCDSCISGYYGKFCNKACPNECVQSACDIRTAQCVRANSRGNDAYIYVIVSSVASVLTTVLLLVCKRKHGEDAGEEEDYEISEESGRSISEESGRSI